MPQKEMFSSQRVLATYVDDMITEKMGNNIDRKTRGTERRNLLDQLNEAFQRGMVEALPDAQLIELNEKLDREAGDAEIEQVFAGAGIDYSAVMMKTLKEFRAKYLGLTQNVVPEAKAAQSGMVSEASAEVAGQPLQGTTSQVQGQSDVEGMAINQEEM